jgi:long-chain acyl-CoA synthetase
LVEEANTGMDPWNRIKRFRIVSASLTTENNLLTPTLKVRRRQVEEAFAEDIREMYGDGDLPASVVVVEKERQDHDD